MADPPTYEALKQRIEVLEKELERLQQVITALRKNETDMRACLDATTETIAVIDREGKVFLTNRTNCERLKVTKEDLLGRSLYDFFPAAVAQRRRSIWGDVFDTGKPVTFEDRRDGIIFEQSAYPVFGDDGRVEKIAIFARDVTDHRRFEAVLREREESLKAILAAIPDPMVIYDKAGTPRYLNPAFTDVFLWTFEELEGQRIPFVPEDQIEVTGKEIRGIYDSGSTARFETRRLTKDGRTLDVVVSAAAIKGTDGVPVGMVANLTDITEKKSLRAKYEQAQKMEAIGTLAGGIAHDFNNLLMGIQGRASLITFELEPAHPICEHIRGIETYVRSASDLTRQLLGVVRGGKYEAKPVDINEVLLSSSAMFGRTKKEIRIHTKTHAQPLVVEADQGQLEQVLLNIFVNAWQAMPDGGELFLETRLVILDDAFCKPHQTKPGRYARVSITDTGIGMDESTRQRIFDPFFTTKEKARGTGLGLASAYGIIENHGGIITVYSEVGHGSTFNLYLLISDKKAYGEVPMEGLMVKGSETILLVDDEEMILEVGSALLKKLGYDVLTAKGGREAVELIQNRGEEIHLVVLDMIMPGMDGGTTFDRIRGLRPGLPVVLSSGYAINGQAGEIMRRGCNGFIHKPFSLSDLSQKLRQILADTKHRG
jgi:two-component system, cell cycle sensor histidine kinase and response regulator CckA